MTLILLIIFQFALVQDSQPTTESNVTIAEIKTAWAKTESKTKSCRFQWTESRHAGENEATDFMYSVMLQNSEHLRIERMSKQFDSERKQNVTENYVTTFDAKTARSYYGWSAVDNRKYPTGFVSFKPSDWDNYHVLPILMAVRPVNKQFSPINECKYTVVAKPVVINGRELLELRPEKPDDGKKIPRYIYYVDPDKDFVITRVAKNLDEQKLWQLDLSHRQHVESGCWLPDSWKLNDYSVNSSAVVKNIKAELNTEFAINQFNFEFPKHTLITDRTFTDPLVYILCEDGRKRIVSSEERNGGIKYLDYVAAARIETRSDRD